MEESDKLIRNEAEAIECLKSNKPTSGYVMLQESIDVAIKALEKQIPKKPTEINDECGYFECPTCGDLIYAEGARFKEHKYCLSCGRKLDWGDEE